MDGTSGPCDYTLTGSMGSDQRGAVHLGVRPSARVAAGAIACRPLESLGITVRAYTRSVGHIEIDSGSFLDGGRCGITVSTCRMRRPPGGRRLI